MLTFPHLASCVVLFALALSAAVFSRPALSQSQPDYSQCYSYPFFDTDAFCPDEGSAHEAAQRHAETFLGGQVNMICPPVISAVYTSWGTATRVRVTAARSGVDTCPSGVNAGGRRFLPANSCAARPTLTQTFVWQGNSAPVSGCYKGCEYQVTGSSGGTVTFEFGGEVYQSGVRIITPTSSPCDFSDPPPNVDEAKEADDGWKCHDGTGHCTDPDGNPHYCTLNPDGSRASCVPARKDDDGVHRDPTTEPQYPEGAEGEGDTNTPGAGKVSGGLDCQAGPSCEGDIIQCAQLYQTWKTRCAVEAQGYASTLTGGGDQCQQAYQAKGGDPLLLALLNEQWRQRCSSPGDGGSADPGAPHDGQPFGVGVGNIPINSSGFDASGWIGGQCVQPPASMGRFPFMQDVGTYWCDLVAVLRAILLAFAAWVSVRVAVS